jgi:glycerophosphoryl diester phosphodiesterase
VRGRPRAGSAAPRTGWTYLDAVLERPGAVLAFAHRGGAAHPDLAGLENTLTAFRHARALGYRYLETDVHTTRDGVLLAFHDRVLDRVTGETGAVGALSLEEVRRARIGGVEPVPTLAELVDALPGARFNVDLKSGGAVPALAAFLVERGLEDRVLVGSFSHRRLRAFRRLTGDRVATSASPVEVAAFRLLPSGRLARAVTRGRVAALQVPRRAGPLEVVTRGLVRRAHAAGAHVHVWTVDDPREMRLLVDRGVDGLMTDRTDILRAVLRTGGQWEGDR